MKCPNCNSEPCYVSLLGNIECSNQNCKFYSATLFPPPMPVPEEEKKEEVKSCTGQSCEPVSSSGNDVGMTYYWVTHHHDFGD